MSTWDKVLKDIQDSPSALDLARRKAIKALADYRGRNVICYYSGWLQGADEYVASLSDDDMNGLMNVMHGLDRGKGLDLVLHTPGGDLAATEAIVHYLRSCFGEDVVAIVPQLAMSAGTMIACSCKEVVMGRQSSLGPTDPQLKGVAAAGVVEEFERAVNDVKECPESAQLWREIIGQYHPTFIGDCQKVVEMSRSLVGEWLSTNMLVKDADADERKERITELLCEHDKSVMHNRHFSYDTLRERGLHVRLLEDDDRLQDKVLTLHHTFMVTFQKSGVGKVVESSSGSKWIVSTAADA